MLTIKDAEDLILVNMPKGSVVKAAIDYDDKYLFIVHRQDELEGFFDPFFSIDKESGYFTDFSPQDYDNPLDVINRLQSVLRN